MTKPRAWPTNAKKARDKAAEETQSAVYILKCLQEYLDDHEGSLNQHEVIVVELKVSKALNKCLTAVRHLESVGAPTRPITD